MNIKKILSAEVENIKNLISLEKLIQTILYTVSIFFFIGIFWILIAENNLMGYILIGAAFIGLTYLVICRLEEIKNFIKKIDWKKASIKSYYILIVLALIVLINVVANKQFLRKDFTAGKQFTLSGHSVKLLNELGKNKNNIKIMFFRTQGALTEPVEDLLKEYKLRCSVISIEFIDPYKDPIRAKEYNIKGLSTPYQSGGLFGTVVILCSGKKEAVDVIKMDYKQMGEQYQPSIDIKENLERELSSALLQITKSKKKIYFVQGHGEVDLDDEQQSGWASTKKVIADENYMIDKIYLISLNKMPEDCSVLIIGAPQKNYAENEYELLNNYLNDGGHILVLLEPLKMININSFLNKWGIATSFKFVVDPERSYLYQAAIPVITAYNEHKITGDLKYLTLFPTAVPVDVMAKLPDGVNAEGLAKTSPGSWAETDPEGKDVKFNKGIDEKGPVNIFAVVTKKIDEKKEARMAIIGDSDFANNSYVNAAGNKDLLLNTLNWLAGKEEMIGIRSKPIDRREIELTKVRLNFIFYFCVIILPLLIIITGVMVWLKRR